MMRQAVQICVAISLTALAAVAFAVPVNADSSATDNAPSRIAELIRKLGDTNYWARELAHEQLAKIGADAFDALLIAQESEDLEIAERARELTHRIRIALVRDNDSPAVKERLKDYESLKDGERLGRLGDLASLGTENAVSALCRLIRFERSPLIAKRGALLILRQAEVAPPGWDSKAATIMKELGGSRRAPARWLIALVNHHDRPEEGLGQWDGYIRDELAVSDANTAGEQKVQTELMRFQAEQLLKLNQRVRALALMQKMAGRISDSPSAIAEFTRWLVKTQAWPVIVELAQRFDHVFHADPHLLYALAQARKETGREATGEDLARQAFEMQTRPHDLNDSIDDRLDLARELELAGLFAWSEREYRFVIDKGPREGSDVLNARFELAELLHDADRDREAAEVYAALVEQMKGNGSLKQKLTQFDPPRDKPELIVSRMHYFYACAAGQRKDEAGQIEHLDQAIASDPTDPDALIALYNLPHQSPERSDRTRQLIRDAAEAFDDELADQPADSPHRVGKWNEYAWLVGNTEGDLDKALKYAKLAVDREPQAGNYLDTLAHCYAAKKDFASAVKYQQQAADAYPYSRQIRRTLEEYKAALNKK